MLVGCGVGVLDHNLTKLTKLMLVGCGVVYAGGDTPVNAYAYWIIH